MKALVTIFLALLGLMAPARAEAWLSASPSSVYFPRTDVDRGSASATVSIYNFGPEAAQGLSLSHSCYGNFDVSHFCFGDLMAGGSCSVQVRFRPYRAGLHSCTITASSFNQGMVSIWVTGEGI